MPDEPTEPAKPIPTVEAPVLVVQPAKKLPEPAQVGDLNTAPTTTAADDLVTQGQRDINNKWESTQQVIAIATTVVVLTVTGYMIYRGDKSEAPFLLLSNVLVLVLTNYFQRTNHQRTGGVQSGDKGR